MTKGMGTITNVFAMSKGITEGTTGEAKINKTADSAANYTGNFLESATYRTPLNPLLSRGIVSEDFADFTMVSNATTINSYEIHKADNDTLTNANNGINLSHQVRATFTYNNDPTVASGDTTGILAGMAVTGTGIPAGATVSSITNTTTFELSASTTGGDTTGALTFTTQTYSSVNRIYPNSTTVSDHLSNLENTRGNILKTYDYETNTGQRFLTERTLVNEAVDTTETVITVDSATNLAVNDVVVIDNEEMLITGISSNDLTVVRGYGDTLATTHADNSRVFEKDIIEHLWVLVYSDDPNLHHFAKITEILEGEVWGDTIEFSPSIGVDIPKDIKFAVFSSLDSNLPKLDSDNQTLVACGYGLQSDGTNVRHYLNTHVSFPFFYFVDGNKLEPAARYVLRSSSWNGSAHTYTYSTFVTAPEYDGDIIDAGPYTMEATIVDMMYKADNPAAMNFLEYISDYLSLTNGSPDTIFLDGGGSNDASFDNSITDLDGTEGTNWGLLGILRDSRFTLDGAEADTYCLDSATNSTVTTLTMDASDFSGASTSTSLRIRFLAHAADLDHNEMYCAFDSTNHMKNAFRMAHRPYEDVSATTFYGHQIGITRYMHYTNSPLTNNLAPNAMELIDYETVTATGGYVDIVFVDTQKILAKKIKQNDPLYIHQIVTNEQMNVNRIAPLAGTFEYTSSGTANTITVSKLAEEEDMRFSLQTSIPNTKTDTSSQYDPIYDAFTVNISGTLYHFLPDRISNKSSGRQTITVKAWRKATDTEYVAIGTTSLTGGSLPNFSTTAYRKKYSFPADNILTAEIPIDTKIEDYSLDYNGASAVPTNINVTSFDALFNTGSLNFGDIKLETETNSRINNINLVLRGGQITGHRLNVDYGDNFNKILKLKTHLKDERFLESYNKTDYTPYSYNLSNVSLYGHPIDSSSSKFDLTTTNNFTRGITGYLDYFRGSYDVEKRVFMGTVESIEQVVEDGMFKLKIRGRNHASKLLGPVINKDFKFTEDIIYSTVGPFERMALYGEIDYHTSSTESADGTDGTYGTYEVGSTIIVVDAHTWTSTTLNVGTIEANKGDLMFTKEGTFIGRIHNIQTDSDGKVITFEEGIPSRLKNGETIFVTKYASLTDIVPDILQSSYEMANLARRGNTVSFAKAMSANPYITTRVNSLSGASNKGIIFTGGNSLSDSADSAPVFESTSLVGTSSSSHKSAKGYSISSPQNTFNDLPFYCNLSDEITDRYTIDYTNLHTVNSLTEYDIVNVSSKDTETIIEIAPICPAILARVDDNPLESRDKNLVSTGVVFSGTTEVGHNGVLYTANATTAMQTLNVNDFIFTSDGTLLGKIIDITRQYTNITVNSSLVLTLDRPIPVQTSGITIYKYYHASDYDGYYATAALDFTTSSSNTFLGDTYYQSAYIKSSNATDIVFLKTLKSGMRIEIQGAAEPANNGTFTLGKVYDDGTDYGFYIFIRRMSGTNYHADGYGSFTDDADDTPTIKVLTDYFTQGLYFLNTQGLSQGGVLTLVNPSLSSPNLADNICKPIKWAGGLYHYITDDTMAMDFEGTKYNPIDSKHEIFSDYIDRYGNTKWRYFGLQKGMSLSYINRRRKDGQIKDTYAKIKGKVNGYATAYRVADAVHGSSYLLKYPYGYHNNEYAWGVSLYDGYHADEVDLFEFTNDNNIKTHPYFLELLSPESRNFRPVMGSNFADFNKHGTWLASPNEGSSYYKDLNYPRYMPQLHDNFRGGDWQRDWECPINPDSSVSGPRTISKYPFNLYTDSGESYFGIDKTLTIGGVTSVTAFGGFGNWVAIDKTTNPNSNRTYYLSANYTDSGDVRYYRFSSPDGHSLLFPPYTDFIDVGGADTTTIQLDTGTTLTGTSTPAESATILNPPWIGPKFDGITRAKDHWELPDPKALRWFIFAPSDMYPDSMSRKHHIGYSGTTDSTTVSRAFTDYNLLLKGHTSKSTSNVYHEYYEGSLDEEHETDDSYEMLPISEALTGSGETMTPSQMKRFGLMRLIDCTYDWHFNLIDPEKLPDNMADLTTPNFEYTRYQGLKKTKLYVGSDFLTSADSSYTTIETVDEDGTDLSPSGEVVVGDNIFTYDGRFLGQVSALDTVSGGGYHITVTQRIETPYSTNAGVNFQYRGPICVCGDGVTAIADQDYYDSFYVFQTKGRGGQNTFTEVSALKPLNMLQGMVNASYMRYDSGVIQYQVPYGAIGSTYDGTEDGPAITYTNADGGSLGIASGGSAAATALDYNITESKFQNHFNGNYGDVDTHANLSAGGGIGSLYALPPSFRTFYSTRTGTANMEKSVTAMIANDNLLSKEGSTDVNPSTTEYCHASNVLEWMQRGGNPYWRCSIVVLGRYNIENSIGIKTPIGGMIKSINYKGGLTDDDSALYNFSWSTPPYTGTPSAFKKARERYGDGMGGYTNANLGAGFGNTASSSASHIVLKGSEYWAYALYQSDTENVNTTSPLTDVYADPDKATYVADGVYGAFVPDLYLGGMLNTVIADGTKGETNEGTITFSSINGNTNLAVIRIEQDPTGGTNFNPFLNFVDLTGMYLVPNLGNEAGKKSEGLTLAGFDGSGDLDEEQFLTDSITLEPFVGGAGYGLGFTNPDERDIPRKGLVWGSGWTGMSNCMVEPRMIHYVYEHRRNVTGSVVAHELLVDNPFYDDAGALEWSNTYRIMRPAENCFWKQSPTDISLNTLSCQTTKMPQEDKMYGYVPSLQRVNTKGEFTGPDVNPNTTLLTQGVNGENEAVMSMYVAIDMDARHSQYKALTGTIAATDGSNVVTSGTGTTFDELQVSDVIKLGNQYCYVKSIKDGDELTIASQYKGNNESNFSGTGYLFNNTYTVVRDYIHLFNPSGNRNTFKSGSSYSMLLTDGVSKQKMSMGVEADYYDERSLCRLTFGDNFKNDMVGIVSLGEIFTLKSTVPTKSETYTSARIGSTVVIGEEVEDVINEILSTEDIEYDIQDDREYPYYISPNYQGVDVFNAANFAARYKERELRIDETGISLIKQTNELDYQPILLSYDNTDLKIISVTRNKSTFDLYNEIIVYGSGTKGRKANRASIEKFGRKTLEDINMELVSQDDVDSRAKSLLDAHSKGDDRFTVKMAKTGIEFVKAGDIITLDFPPEGIEKGQYKIYEIRRELAGLIELEVGTYRKDLAARFAELSIANKANTSAIRGNKHKISAVPLDFFDSLKIKELRMVIKRIGLVDTDAFTLGFQTDSTRLLDFGATMGPLETVTEILIDEDFI
jgi:hypothetical protein